MSNRKLLLADDSITIQKVVNLTFADEGIDVIAVGDGNSAMDKLREDMPDLVMADVNMPGLNGYEICEKIKLKENGNADTPVILLVGSFEPFDEEEASRVGADDYLTKPFQSISQLVEKVTELLKIENDESLADTAEMFVKDDNSVSENIETSPEEMSANIENSWSTKQGLKDDFVDDEMIQTSQVGSVPIDDSIKYESNSENTESDDESQNAETSFEVEDEVEELDPNRTQPFTRLDYKELAIDDSIDASAFEDDKNDLEISDNTVDETDTEITQLETEDQVEREFVVGDSSDLKQEVQPQSSQTANEEVKLQDSGESNEEVKLQDSGESNEEVKLQDFGESNEEVNQVISEEINKEPDMAVDAVTTKTSETIALTQSDKTSEKDQVIEMINQDQQMFDDFEEETSDLPMPQAASILELDELNLLDLPPLDVIEEKPIVETVSEEGAFVSKDVASHSVVNSIANSEFSEIANEMDEDVSPETVKVIAEKIVERISKKEVREIAWEVVPELAELIIKKMAKEKIKD